MTWNMSEASDRLGEVLKQAEVEPQMIIRQDRAYVLLTADEYRKLKGQEPTFTDFLIDAGPRFDDLELMKRPETPMRDAQLRNCCWTQT